MERLQQCQKERHDVSRMLHAVTQGHPHFLLWYKHLTSCKCDTLKGLFAAKLPSAFLSLLRADSRCSLCPGGWLWWRGCCYFFSVGLQENRRWNESAEFCQQHNSSLVVIKDSAEMVTRMWFCKWKQHVGGSGDVVNTTLVETKARSSGLQDTRVKITQRIRTVEM